MPEQTEIPKEILAIIENATNYWFRDQDIKTLDTYRKESIDAIEKYRKMKAKIAENDAYFLRLNNWLNTVKK